MDLELVTEEEAQDILKVRNVDNASYEQVVNSDTTEKPLIKVTELPSGFKGYPEGTTISYDPITLGELEALNNGESIDVERGIAMLLKAIHCTTLPSENLYYWDVIYIGIKRKLTAFGDTRGVAYAICPKCGNIVEREFDYTELEFKELQAPDLPAIVNINGKEVEIGLLTMRDYLELDDEKTDLDVYAKMIKNLPFKEALDLVKNAKGKDIKVLRYVDEVLNYGLKPLKQECKGELIIDNPEYDPNNKKSKKKIKEKCKEQVNVEVRSPFEVVFPENKDNRPDDIEIQFGRK